MVKTDLGSQRQRLCICAPEIQLQVVRLIRIVFIRLILLARNDRFLLIKHIMKKCQVSVSDWFGIRGSLGKSNQGSCEPHTWVVRIYEMTACALLETFKCPP